MTEPAAFCLRYGAQRLPVAVVSSRGGPDALRESDRPCLPAQAR
jgi:hypothetical protein